MIGIDYASVSGNNPPDWRAAKAAGIGFAFVRASFAYKPWFRDYQILPDPHFARDWTKIPNSIVKGAYMFPEPRAKATSYEQVKVFKAAVDAQGGLQRGIHLPPVLDIEFPGGLTKAKLTRKQALLWMKDAAHAMMDAFDVNPILYTSSRVWDGEDDDALNADTMQDLVGELKECPLWLARYPYKERLPAILTPPWASIPTAPTMWGEGNYWFWQYQGDALKCPGFSADVDMNTFFEVKLGEKGERVKGVQKRIGSNPDGIFGPNTQKALVEFQKNHNLFVSGIVDIATFATLAWV